MAGECAPPPHLPGGWVSCGLRATERREWGQDIRAEQSIVTNEDQRHAVQVSEHPGGRGPTTSGPKGQLRGQQGTEAGVNRGRGGHQHVTEFRYKTRPGAPPGEGSWGILLGTEHGKRWEPQVMQKGAQGPNPTSMPQGPPLISEVVVDEATRQPVGVHRRLVVCCPPTIPAGGLMPGDRHGAGQGTGRGPVIERWQRPGGANSAVAGSRQERGRPRAWESGRSGPEGRSNGGGRQWGGFNGSDKPRVTRWQPMFNPHWQPPLATHVQCRSWAAAAAISVASQESYSVEEPSEHFQSTTHSLSTVFFFNSE